MNKSGSRVDPGGTVGILGGGQLGRMIGIAARRMGYRVHTYEPSPDSPAGQISDVHVVADYRDHEALRRFAESVDVLSFEFENIPLEAVETASAVCPVRPRGEVLHICQNREREKQFLKSRGFPCANFRVVASSEDLAAARSDLGSPSVLKTADFGYDGKGQIKLSGGEAAPDVWREFGAPRGVLEEWVPFESELSVIAARTEAGAITCFPASENRHANHILDLSIAPAGFDPSVLHEAESLAKDLSEALNVVGLLAVEFFLCPGGRLVVNELAPRPHNSGHGTFDACVTSQFEQHVRAVCNLPLGSPAQLSPSVMWNLLGDLWADGAPDWSAILAHPSAKLHLYGKRDAKPGRKMGHVTFLGPTRDSLAFVETLRTPRT